MAQTPQGGAAGRPLLARFAEEVGEEIALQISARFGGRQLYIPNKPPVDSDLVAAIGQVAAHKLAKRFGGISYAIPIASGKRARIVALLQDGKTKAEVADLVGCTERYVYRVQADHERDQGAIPRRRRKRRARRSKKNKAKLQEAPPQGLRGQEAAGQTNLFSTPRED